jgi:predicted dehydrogenase
MTSQPIHVGVIGAGMSAQVFHLPTLLTTPTMRVTHIVARQPPAFALPAHISYPAVCANELLYCEPF